MSKAAIVTGAGSGVGQAVAITLSRQGWKVGLVGRREEALRATARAGEESNCLVCPCDIGDAAAVEAMTARFLGAHGRIDALVNCAGNNVPERSLEELSLENYHLIMGANVHGAYYTAQAVLPIMRQQRSGTIVNIVSEAGKMANAKAGPAYVISKFGQAGLSQAINTEERAHGIRACAIFPGDIDTPRLDKRPHPPGAEAREKMLRAEDVADCVILCLNLPARAVVEELLLRPA